MRPGLLEMEHTQVLQLLADLQGVVGRKCAINVHQDFDVITHGGTNFADGVHSLVGGVVGGSGHRAVKLVSRIPFLDEGDGAPGLFHRGQVPPHRTSVHPYLVPEFASQQLVDR